MISLFSLFGCSKVEDIQKNDDILSISKTSYTGSQLRVDGYYYTLINGEINTIHVLYNNGILQHFGVSECGMDFSKAELYFTKVNVKDVIKKNKYFWGVFLIDNNDIKLEEWQSSTGGSMPAYVSAGEILNDTTFNLTEMYRMKNGQKTEFASINEVYHFKQYSPKPDSTNSYIP